MPDVIIVLGMHKSGTTLVSKMLHDSGIEMVEEADAKSYDKGNQFERDATNRFNKQLLRCGTRNSLQVIEPMDSAAVGTDIDTAARDLIGSLSSDGKPWGFKDPRTCLTFDFWKSIVPDHKLVGVYRHPEEVYWHYVSGQPSNPKRGMMALRAWYIYNENMLAALRGSANGTAILVEYARLMWDDEEFSRLSRFVGVSLADSRRRDLHRFKGKKSLRYSWDCWLTKRKYGMDVGKMHSDLEAFRAVHQQ